MKKYSLLLPILFLAACTAQTDKMLDESSVKQYGNNEIPEVVPVPKKTEQKQNMQTNNTQTDQANRANQANQTNQQSSMENPRTTISPSLELKDLAQEYSAAVIKTSMGDIKVKFYGEDSPLTVNNFMNLAQSGFYNGTRFHRIIADFMIQGGDPNSKEVAKQAMWGTGGPDYRFRDEFNSHPLVKGSLAMANSGPATNGSQFFIVTAESTPWLDGKHTNFGEVVEGLDVVEKIGAVQTGQADRPVEEVLVNSVELVK